MYLTLTSHVCYSTIWRTLLHIDYKQYSGCLARFFDVQPQIGETIALDSKVLRGFYQIENDNPNCESHPAIMLVNAYIVEPRLILEPKEVECKTSLRITPQLFFSSNAFVDNRNAFWGLLIYRYLENNCKCFICSNMSTFFFC